MKYFVIFLNLHKKKHTKYNHNRGLLNIKKPEYTSSKSFKLFTTDFELEESGKKRHM